MQQIERSSGVSLWRQIHDQLKSEILSGIIKPGGKLETEANLSSRFAVNRHTIRRAISCLSESGLVEARQGYGTFVPESVVDYAVHKRTRFNEVIGAQSRTAKTSLIAATTIASRANVAKALAIRKGTRVLCIRTIGEADGRRMSLADHYFEAKRFKGLEDFFQTTGSISKALAMCGIMDYSRKTTRVTASLASARDAELLAQPTSRPVLLSESINITPDGQPLEYGRTLFAGDRVQMVFES